MRNTVRNFVMNIKGAPVFFGCLSAMLTHLISLPYFFSQVLPVSIVNRRNRTLRIFDKVINSLAAIPKNLTLWGAESCTMLFASFTTQFTKWVRFPLRIVTAFCRTKDSSLSKIFGHESYSALWANLHWLALFVFPIARIRTIFSLIVPIIKRSRNLFFKDLVAVSTMFSKFYHSCPPMISISYSG